MRKSKSQAAIFLIIGLLLIIIVVAFLMLGRFAAKKVAKEETVNSNEAAFDVQPIRTFVTECTTILTKDAIELMGQQGGYLYRSQGGSLIDYPPTDEGLFFVTHEDKKVAYNILKPRFSIGKYSASIPTYPWSSFPYSDATKGQLQFEADSVFGTNNVPVINKSYGQHSMQEQLVRYIESNIEHCLDDAVFDSLGFLVDKKDKQVEVAINEDDIVVRLFYDMVITNLATSDKTSLQSFLTRIPIRLGEIQFFINDIVQKDITDVQYDLSSASGDGFVVEVRRDFFKNDDLIVVTDLQTKINDKEFEYIFGRKNRHPALFLIPDKTFPRFVAGTSDFTVITQDKLLGTTENPSFLDPDEDDIESYSIFPELPLQFIFPTLEFEVEITDGELVDTQIVTIHRGPEETGTLVLAIPDLELVTEENAQQLLVSDLTTYLTSPNPTPSNLFFSVVNNDNPEKASCSVQNDKQLVCISHVNEDSFSKITVQAYSDTSLTQDTFILHAVQTPTLSTCGDRVCHFASESCETCPEDCYSCEDPNTGSFLKCGFNPITFCQRNVVCPPGFERVGSISKCGDVIVVGERGPRIESKQSYTCYQVRFTEACQQNPVCDPDEVELEEQFCV